MFFRPSRILKTDSRPWVPLRFSSIHFVDDYSCLPCLLTPYKLRPLQFSTDENTHVMDQDFHALGTWTITVKSKESEMCNTDNKGSTYGNYQTTKQSKRSISVHMNAYYGIEEQLHQFLKHDAISEKSCKVKPRPLYPCRNNINYQIKTRVGELVSTHWWNNNNNVAPVGNRTTLPLKATLETTSLCFSHTAR
jgi:hypothetical protein